MSKFTKGAIIVGLVFIVGLIGFFSFTTTVNTGNAGLVISLNGGLKDKVLGQGMKPVAPWNKVVQYPISTETVYLSKENKDDFPTVTNEGKQVPVDARYSYHMNVEKLPDVYRKFRGASNTVIENGWIKTELQKTVRSVTSKYSVFELNGSKVSEINAEVLVALSKALAPDGIIIEDFSLGAIHPDEKTLESIQANVDAQLILQRLTLEKQQKTIEAEKAVIEAQGKADSVVIDAQGKADANRLLEKSATPELIALKKIEVELALANNPNLPRMIVNGGNGGSDSGLLFSIPESILDSTATK